MQLLTGHLLPVEAALERPPGLEVKIPAVVGVLLVLL